MLKIGSFIRSSKVIVAPMAGVSDQPFRNLCREFGAQWVVSEMVTSDSRLWNTRKSQQRLRFHDEVEPRWIQIAGAEPAQMANAAIQNVRLGAQIIDINMGCPAKKICNVMAGSALLQDEQLVSRILKSVVSAVDVPVTLKIRTGWDTTNRNAVKIARIAESEGIAALAIHGRTRACGYRGHAEYDSIAEVKSNISIPVIANGDITTPESAKYVLEYTGADGIMIGRAAQGRPWIFREIQHYLRTGEKLPEPEITEIRNVLLGHLDNLYSFYGEYTGVRVARKHISWYSKGQRNGAAFRQAVNRVETATEQLQLTKDFFNEIMMQKGIAA